MAIVHQATLNPTKLEFLTAYLDMLQWGGGPIDLVGGYRLDDPNGKVGIEGLIATRGDDAFHIPVTYRDAPLEGADAYLITTLEHSYLGKRWVYDAAHDPVAIDAYLRVLAGDQKQAKVERHDAQDQFVEVVPPPVVIEVKHQSVVSPSDFTFVRRLELGASLDPEATSLIAEWAGNNSAIVALA